MVQIFIIKLAILALCVIPSLAFSDDILTVEEYEAIKVLKDGGNVSNLNVDSDNISYTRNVCVTAGNTQEVDQRFTICRDVDFTLARKNLKVRSYGRDPILTGEPVIRLQATITRKQDWTWEEYPVQYRQDLERNFQRRERRNRTNFPIANEKNVSQISNAFDTLAK